MTEHIDQNLTPTRTKSMTCAQLGGPCDVIHRGDDANEIIQAQDQHLRDAVAAGEADHEPALKDMKGRWKRPISGMKWYRQVQRDFDALPVDPPSGEGPGDG